MLVTVRQSRGEPGISAHVSHMEEGLMCMGKVGGQNNETIPSNLPQGVQLVAGDYRMYQVLSM